MTKNNSPPPPQTLEEISNLVKDITLKLRDKKVLLQPQIKELKDARKHFQEVENMYFQKRSNYEKVAVGLEVDRQQLEQVRRRRRRGSCVVVGVVGGGNVVG